LFQVSLIIFPGTNVEKRWTSLPMYKYMERRLLFALLLVAIILAASSCGRVAPVHEPGQITVTSTPAGAAIILDGQDTGQITPATISDLAPGNYVVTVQLASHVTSPPQTVVELSELEVVPTLFTLDATVGQLVVESDPTGAAIWIDGSDTGQTTPATIEAVTAGTVIVTLVHPEVHFSPSEYSADVLGGEQTLISAETFASRSRRTVLFEGFSNVDCNGCPEMAANVHALMTEEPYSLDRVLYIKYSMQWPNVHDPHYVHNEAENNARYLNDYSPLYGYFAIPTLIVDGAMTGTGGNPPDLSAMRTLVNAGTAVADPQFLIDVSADVSGLSIPVTVTLTAAADIDLSSHSLHVALVQSDIHYDVAPGSQGETDFHWVFRDKADTTPALGALTSGSPLEFNLTVNRDDWDLETLHVIAFVQHDTSFEILQAGATMITGSTGLASAFLNNNNHHPDNTPGGNRP
jgi:hypothetical protein